MSQRILALWVALSSYMFVQITLCNTSIRSWLLDHQLYAQTIVKCCKNAQVELAIVACVKCTGLTHKCCKNAQVELAIVVCVKRTGLTHKCCKNAQVDLLIGAGVKNAQAEPVIGTCVKRTG